MRDLRLAGPSLEQIAGASAHLDWRDVAAAVADARVGWYDGLDPATAFALVWIEKASGRPGVEEVVGMAARLGYRHARLLLRTPRHPSFSRPRVADYTGDVLVRSANALAADPSFDRLPVGVLRCHRHLTQVIAETIADTGPAGLVDQLRPLVALALDLGFAVGVLEDHAAAGRPLDPF